MFFALHLCDIRLTSSLYCCCCFSCIFLDIFTLICGAIRCVQKIKEMSPRLIPEWSGSIESDSSTHFTHIIFSSFVFLFVFLFVSISFVLLFNCFQLISQLKIFMIFPFKYFLSFVCFCFFFLSSYIVVLWMFCDLLYAINELWYSRVMLICFFFSFFQFSSIFWTKIRRIVDG